MSRFPKPRVVVSECLGFTACRYNGEIIRDDFVPKLDPFVQWVKVCPEVEIGLGTPRDPIRIVQVRDSRRLLQPSTALDLTARMERFSAEFLEGVGAVDGFLLKSRSPSCGIAEVRVYPEREKMPALGKGPGLFGEAVLSRCGHLAVEDEGRLRNFRIREHFLTRLFAFARLRELGERCTPARLVSFHTAHKLLLMACSETGLRALGKVVANHGKLPAPEVFSLYREEFHRALHRLPGHRANLNVLMHAMGYFKTGLSSREKAQFLDTLERYRAAKVPLSVPVALVRSWIVRFEEPYLAGQHYFEPYPEALVEISDSGKGRDA